MQGWGENATGNQSLLLLGVIGETAGHNPSHRLVTVANQYLFAVSYELDVSAELRLQIADIDGSHVAVIADVTMLVICYFTVWNASAKEHRQRTNSGSRSALERGWHGLEWNPGGDSTAAGRSDVMSV